MTNPLRSRRGNTAIEYALLCFLISVILFLGFAISGTGGTTPGSGSTSGSGSTPNPGSSSFNNVGALPKTGSLLQAVFDEIGATLKNATTVWPGLPAGEQSGPHGTFQYYNYLNQWPAYGVHTGYCPAVATNSGGGGGFADKAGNAIVFYDCEIINWQQQWMFNNLYAASANPGHFNLMNVYGNPTVVPGPGGFGTAGSFVVHGAIQVTIYTASDGSGRAFSVANNTPDGNGGVKPLSPQDYASMVNACNADGGTMTGYYAGNGIGAGFTCNKATTLYPLYTAYYYGDLGAMS